MAENLMQAQKTGPFLSFSPSLPQPPCNKESLVTYYGVYSSSHRGKCMRENREERVEETVVEVSTEIESLHTETASRGFQPNAE